MDINESFNVKEYKLVKLFYIPSGRRRIGGEVSLSVDDRAEVSNGPPNT